ncbi:MAG TPA: ABC transporter ATP-binding protein [Candidatus Saccharimonadales bacterium]|nr:ABC transporter ATP-binding protein [Candidatus Saccharimonadales bacterium]
MNVKPDYTSMRTKETLRLYWHATLRHKPDLWQACLLPASNVMLGVFVPFFASQVLANLVSRGPRLWEDFAWFVAMSGVGLLCNTTGTRRSMVLQAKVMSDLNDQLFRHLLKRSVGFYNNQIGGKLISDAQEFIGSYGLLWNAGFMGIFGFLLTTIVGLVLVFASNWLIGLSITILLVGLFYWTRIENARRMAIRNERLKISKQLVAHLSDSIVNAVTVKTFAKETDELATNWRINQELTSVRIKDWQRTVVNEGNRMAVLLLMQLGLIVILIQTTAHRPQLLASGIFAFTYTLTLINRFFSVNTMTRQIDEALLQASPMTGLLQQSAEITDAPDASELVAKSGEIVYRDVTFSYADSTNQQKVFNKLNLHIASGEKIGLIGHSGGGKSTFTRLLLRFDDISAGSITIDGQDIKTVTQASLRQAISYVPQEPLLFHRTIRENIAYGQSNATEKAVEAAAKQAHAHDFISKLPDGYNTVVGERGVKLSGGQRQRVAIARAILKDAPILVLDEATSALDSESEKAIQKALWELMKDRTAVVVAHRLSTIQKMDRIVVLDEGKIVEEGSHAVLLQKNGLYARLWKHQSGGFIEE